MDNQKSRPDDVLSVWAQNEQWYDQDFNRPDNFSKEWESNDSSSVPLLNRTETADRPLFTDSAIASDCSSSSSSSTFSSPTSSSCSHFDVEGTSSNYLQTSKNIERFPPEKWKTLWSILFYGFSLLLNLTSVAIITDRVSRGPPLPDMVFDIIPRIEEAQVVSETIIAINIAVTLFVLTIHKHRFIVLRRLFLILGILYLMRSVTMFVTQLPVSKETRYCAPKENFTTVAVVAKRVTHMLTGFGMAMSGRNICCGDYIYSGHTVTLAVGYLFVSEYTPSRWSLLRRFQWLTSFTGIVCLVLAQGHYTIDVLIAYYATTRTFWIYHTMANSQILKNPGRNNFLSRVWWFLPFRYCEQNVGGVLPLEYEWPLPRLRRWPLKARRP